MARESALWRRVKDAGNAALIAGRCRIDLQRIENDVGAGHPDVDGCIDAVQVWIELKSCDRPKRPSTPLRLRSNPKTREAQKTWHVRRAAAGCRHNWVLLQAGEAYSARLYLIPGTFYEALESPEAELELLSFCDPADKMIDVLLKAKVGW